MRLFSFFKKKANQSFDSHTENVHEEVRRGAFFLDEKLHKHYMKYGWVVVKNVIEKQELDLFQQTYDHIATLDGYHLGDTLLNSGRVFNPEIRKLTREAIMKNAETILPRMFDMSQVDNNTSGSFIAKPPSDQSGLQVHQDSTVIDEENDYCLFVWIPFCDLTEQNGPVWVLDGSHLWGNTQRSLGVPWYLEKHADFLKKHMHPVIVNAGDAVIFDPALLHCSTPNYSDKLRLAVTVTVLRKNYQLVYYYKNKNIPSNKIEKYFVDENFYYGYDFASKPDEAKWRKQVVDYKSFDLTQKQLESLIIKHKPQLTSQGD